MKIGLIGLGRMGAGIAERLLAGGHEVVGESDLRVFGRSCQCKTRAPAKNHRQNDRVHLRNRPQSWICRTGN